MDNIDDLKEVFIAECYEMIEGMEKHLIDMESNPNVTSEVLNAIFRGAHSIKGGAGALGFERIYKFTHGLEALLDALRSGQKSINLDVVDALLAGVDIVRRMVDAESANEMLPEGFGRDIQERIEKILVDGAQTPELKILSPEEVPANASLEQGNPNTITYNIEFKPNKELFSTGNDPLFILKQLQGLGKIEVNTDLSKLPKWDEFNQQDCYFSWNIILETEAAEASIKEAFEFVEGLAEINISKEQDVGKKLEEKVDSAKNEKKESTELEKVKVEKLENKVVGAVVEETKVSSPHTATVRVDVDKIDRMVNMVGELVISQSMLIAKMANLPIEMQHLLEGNLNDLSRKTRELQGAVMSVRMQPVQSIFSRMIRLSRDLSHQLNKPFKLVTAGEGTEVDKTIIEKLSDPITHMIRNAADHGLETPEERIAAGKPAEGVINLSAYHSGGKIVIEIEDDGAGIKRDKVLAKAKSKGLVMQDAELSPEQIDTLIFLPGFSTAEAVSTISGRGVGMDVVDRNIKELGGDISIHNTPGKGLRFTITLPLTLAILDGMVVAAGAEKYIIPIVNMMETFRPRLQDIQTIANGNDLINIRGEFLPIVYLYDLLKIPNAKQNANEALVVVIESGRNRFGLVVDSLLGQQQVVIKRIDDQSETIPGISGATILGDGKISLILDVSGIYKMLNHHIHSKPIEAVV